MPTWLTLTLNIISLGAMGWGCLFFPLVPMFFGVYGARRDTLQGRGVIALLLAFIPVSIASAYLSWQVSTFFALAPYAHLIIIFALRFKNTRVKPDENADFGRQVDYQWAQFGTPPPNNPCVYFSFQASNENQAQALYKSLVAQYTLAYPFDSRPSEKGSYNFDAAFRLAPISKESFGEMVNKIAREAYAQQCIITHFTITNDDF